MQLLIQQQIKPLFGGVYNIIEFILHPHHFLFVLFNLKSLTLLDGILNGIYFVLEFVDPVV